MNPRRRDRRPGFGDQARGPEAPSGGSRPRRATLLIVVALELLGPSAMAQIKPPIVADERWNGTWREEPARSHLFYPGMTRVWRDRHGAYRIGDEEGVVRCGSPGPHGLVCHGRNARRFESVRRSPGPPATVTRWDFTPRFDVLTVTTRTVTPRGPPAREWSRYIRVSGAGLAGRWRKVGAGETPTTYILTLADRHLHVRTADGLLDFRSPLLGRAPTPFDRREQNHVYGLFAPRHLIELSYDGPDLIGRSDLQLASDGASFAEHHTDGRGRSARLMFKRVQQEPATQR